MAIDIVCEGWELVADGAELYPDDLPTEWRLSYFANALGAVYLPAGGWLDQPEQTLSDWHDDVHSGFRFFLECAPDLTDTSHAVIRARRALGDRFAGLVCDELPCSLIAGDETPWWHRVEDVDALGRAANAWAGAADGLALHQPASGDEHPRRIRQRLEALRRLCGPIPLLLVLEPPCAATVLRWRTIAELLGWP